MKDTNPLQSEQLREADVHEATSHGYARAPSQASCSSLPLDAICCLHLLTPPDCSSVLPAPAPAETALCIGVRSHVFGILHGGCRCGECVMFTYVTFRPGGSDMCNASGMYDMVPKQVVSAGCAGVGVLNTVMRMFGVHILY